MGPFPPSCAGNAYLLVFQDLYTRWIECVPLRKANGKNIAKAFEDLIVFRFGAPEVLLTDNGTEFVNRTVDEVTKAYGIHHSTTPPYHAQANPVERIYESMADPASPERIETGGTTGKVVVELLPQELEGLRAMLTREREKAAREEETRLSASLIRGLPVWAVEDALLADYPERGEERADEATLEAREEKPPALKEAVRPAPARRTGEVSPPHPAPRRARSRVRWDDEPTVEEDDPAEDGPASTARPESGTQWEAAYGRERGAEKRKRLRDRSQLRGPTKKPRPNNGTLGESQGEALGAAVAAVGRLTVDQWKTLKGWVDCGEIGLREAPKCWNCGATGHRHRDCRQPKRRYCEKCSERGTERDRCLRCAAKRAAGNSSGRL
ncbi:uncharacterized protein LOC107274353 [Cephus cinctus]|uniref:Uncharacterized protein LOC107274353 n=1 Tax=Cephus cinctus TaxID=211228 RepID=A0AAJ7CFP4_CEPCN|nr:uncharacterized protein LOC107274353 [Cephus cinctus]